MSQQYSNGLTPEILIGLKVSLFTAEEIASMGNEACAVITEEIINSQQGHTYLVMREGIAPGADFLTVTGA